MRIYYIYKLSDTFIYDIGMQCNGSDGTRLPGLWDNVAVPHIKSSQSPAVRKCPATYVSHAYNIDRLL